MANLCLSTVLVGAALFSTTVMAPLTFRTSIAPGRLTQSGDSITIFWEKFRTAVVKGDKETVAALSRFPISRGYGMKSLKTKTQLLRHYRELFFAETDAAKCFPTAKPYFEKTRPKEFTISCPFASGGSDEEPFVYTFTLTRTGWKFTGFENINE